MELGLEFKSEPCNWKESKAKLASNLPQVDFGSLLESCPVCEREKAERVWLAFNRPIL